MGRNPKRPRATSALAGLPPPGPLRPVARETLSDQAARALIVSILLGHFRPGEPLPSSADLARRFGASKPVIREALQIVATLGMVETRQGRAGRVSERAAWRDLSHEILTARIENGAIDDILGEGLELRRVIETEAAALAAERATEDDLAFMRRQLDALEGSSRDPQAYSTCDIAFHDAVLRATHNRLFLQLIDSMREMLVFVRRVSITASADRIPTSLEGHRSIFAAIAGRLPEEARKAMADHLTWAERVNVGQYRTAGIIGTRVPYKQPSNP